MLMINSTRYLVNQLFFDRTGDKKYNNRENGLTKWLLSYMQTVAKHDFLEFNARPYQRLSLHVLFNLHEFARDASVRTAAQILLDYIMVKFAISSNRQRRISPFRRLKENTNRPTKLNELLREEIGGDPLTGFFLTYAGPTDRDGNPTNRFPMAWGFNAVIAGLAAYRPPAAAYILAMQRDIPAFHHRFYHGARPKLPGTDDQADGGVEIYYRSPSFLLTAGGMFLNSGYGGDEFTGFEQTAIAQSTTLLPTRADVKFADLIRFDPYPDERRAVNTAMHLGFACGANLRPSEKKVFRTGSSESTTHAPALASHDGRLFLAWKGSGNQNLNVAKVYTTGELDMDGIEGLEGKVTLGDDTSEQGPALASHNGKLMLAWRGANESLRLMLSSNGAFHEGPWFFIDLSRLGLYVVAYRTEGVINEIDYPELDNLAFLYAMESKGMDFETFKRLTLERNTSLPAKLVFNDSYIFHTADNHRFAFRLLPSEKKYLARVFRDDGQLQFEDLRSLPLIEGPYLKAPGGHDGLIEVRHPGCEATPLVLDFRNPEKPVRLDNISACPEPWLDRAQALFGFAQTLSRAGNLKEEQAALIDRVKIYQQLAEVDRDRHGPELASAMILALGKSGIDFSVPEEDLREWLNNPEFTPYPAISEALLGLLESKRLRQPVFLDVIVFNYEDTPGVSSPRSVADVDFALLRAAVLEGYNTRYGEAVTDFQSLVR